MIASTPIPYVYRSPCRGIPTTYAHLRANVYDLDEVFFRIRVAILRHDYVTAKQLLEKKANYEDGVSETVYGDAVSFVIAGDIRNALKAYECAESPGPPDVLSLNVPWDTNRAIDLWLGGRPSDAVASLREILKNNTYYDEGDFVLGMMEFRRRPRRAFRCWFKIVDGKDGDGPPPYNLPSLAAAELLIHYEPLPPEVGEATCP